MFRFICVQLLYLHLTAWSSVEAVASALPSASAPETFSLFLLELLLCAAATITQRRGTEYLAFVTVWDLWYSGEDWKNVTFELLIMG